MTPARACRGYRFPAGVTPWAVRRSLQFGISYRDLERMLADRGVAVDHFFLRRRLPTRVRVAGKNRLFPRARRPPFQGFGNLIVPPTRGHRGPDKT